MSELTVKRMDAAILRAYIAPVSILDPQGLIERDRAVFLAGMKAAAKMEHYAREIPIGSEWDGGHDAHVAIILATIKRLKREAK